MVDLKRLMDPKTAVSRATEALGAEAGAASLEPVAALASAIMIREGLVAIAKVLDADGGDRGGVCWADDRDEAGGGERLGSYDSPYSEPPPGG